MIYINDHKGLAETVFYALHCLSKNGKRVEGENQSNKDILLEDILFIKTYNPLGKEYCIPKCLAGGLEDLKSYVDEFLYGTKDGKFTYTYHEIYSQYMDRCKAEIERYPYTRRAVLPLAGEASYASQYPPCLQLIIPRIIKLENDVAALNLTAVFRSNDAVNAFPMNIFALAVMQKQLAEEFNVEVGDLIYMANSFHCYSRDIPKLEGYADRYEWSTHPSEYAFTMDEYKEVCDNGNH